MSMSVLWQSAHIRGRRASIKAPLNSPERLSAHLIDDRQPFCGATCCVALFAQRRVGKRGG